MADPLIPQIRATFELLTPSFPLSFEPRDDRMSHERAAIDKRNGRPGTALGVAGGVRDAGFDSVLSPRSRSLSPPQSI